MTTRSSFFSPADSALSFPLSPDRTFAQAAVDLIEGGLADDIPGPFPFMVVSLTGEQMQLRCTFGQTGSLPLFARLSLFATMTLRETAGQAVAVAFGSDLAAELTGGHLLMGAGMDDHIIVFVIDGDYEAAFALASDALDDPSAEAVRLDVPLCGPLPAAMRDGLGLFDPSGYDWRYGQLGLHPRMLAYAFANDRDRKAAARALAGATASNVYDFDAEADPFVAAWVADRPADLARARHILGGKGKPVTLTDADACLLWQWHHFDGGAGAV